MKRFTFLLGLTACVDAPEVTFEAQEVVAPNGINVQWGACSTSDVSPANFVRFTAALRNDLMPRARTIANSPAFKSCVRTAMNAGGSQLRLNRWQYPSGVVKTFGPFFPTTSDVGFSATRDLTVERVRDLYAERVLIEATSPHAFVANCMLQGGGWADGLSAVRDFAAAEEISISKDFFNEDPAPNGSSSRFGFRSFTASVIWHELMHERGYWHLDPDILDYNKRIPTIVGACMDEAFFRSETSCGLSACAGGFMALTDFNGDAGSCACVRDPGTNTTPSLVQSWGTWKGLIKVALDGSGQAYALASTADGTAVFKRDGANWVQMLLAEDMVVGGDAVSVKLPASAYAPAWWWTIPRVGLRTSAWSANGEVMSMDSFSRLIRVVNGQVERKRGDTPWVSLGPATTVAAGSDLLYKISGGALSRLDDGPNPTWTALGTVGGALAVDAYGTLYDLASNQSIYRHRGQYWEHIGGPNDQIGADASFFTHSPVDGWVYRRTPDNGWTRVAQCSSFATGGRSLVCWYGIKRLALYEF